MRAAGLDCACGGSKVCVRRIQSVRVAETDCAHGGSDGRFSGLSFEKKAVWNAIWNVYISLSSYKTTDYGFSFRFLKRSGLPDGNKRF